MALQNPFRGKRPQGETSTSKAPSSLLPDEARGFVPHGPEVVSVSPASLLSEESRWQHEEVAAPERGPSSLLSGPERPSGSQRRDPREDLAAVSPTELLPPVVLPPEVAQRRTIIGIIGVLLVTIGLALVSWQWSFKRLPDAAASIQEASVLGAKGDLVAAIGVLKGVARYHPEHAEARFLLGTYRHAHGDFVQAEQDFRAALELGFDQQRGKVALARTLLMQGAFQSVLDGLPAPLGASTGLDSEIDTIRGLAYLGLGKIEDARVLFDRVLQKDPAAVDPLLGKARIAALENRSKEVEVLIDQALRYDSRNLDALLLQAEVQWALGRTERAQAHYRALLQLYPANAQAHLSLAWMAIRAGQLEAAEAHSRVARKAVPDSPQSNYVHALVEFRRGNLPAAQSAVDKALRVSPNDVASLMLAGGIAYAQEQLLQAKHYLLRGLERMPTHLDGRKLYGATLIKMNQANSALDVLLSAVQAAGEDAELLKLIGQCYLQAGDQRRALAYLEKAATMPPREASRPTEVGLSQLAGGQLIQTLAALESGLLTQPDDAELEVLLVATYVDRKDIARAEHHWSALHRRAPQSPTTLRLQAAILAQKNDVAGARKLLEQALMLRPTYVPAAVGLARIDLQENDPLSARNRLTKVLRVDPRNADAMLALAKMGPAIQASREEIVGWLTDAHKLKPGFASIAVLLAQRHLESGKAEEALAVARSAQRSHPEHTGVLNVLGAAQVMAGDAVGALGTFVQLASLLPKSPDVLFRLGQMQAQTGSDVAARLTLGKALELAPDHADAAIALAELLLRSGLNHDVMPLAQRLQAKAETAARGYTLEGDAHAATGNLQAAMKAYERALEFASDSTPLLRLHEVLVRMGREKDADQRLQKWLAKHPEEVDARVYWGDILLERKNYADAIAEYLAVLARRPDNARVHNNLAWAMFEVGDQRARRHADRALALQPNDPVVLDTMGWLLVNQNEVERGIELLRRAASRAPDKLEVRVRLAQAWLKAGNRANARLEIEHALRSNPPGDRASELERLLKEATL